MNTLLLRDHGVERVVVLGDGRSADRLLAATKHAVQVVGVLDDDTALPVEIPPHDAVVVMQSAFDRLSEVLPNAKSDGTVVVVTDESNPVPKDPLDPALSRRARAFKRAVDIAAGVAGLTAAAPVIAAAAVAIKLDSPGPVFFSQERVGLDGRLFRIYKLRSMKVDNDDRAHAEYVAALIRGEADRHNGMFKLVDDPRITRVGKFLRRFSIDELPQIWNVLKGDMSLIGPRPALPRETALFDARAWQRLRVKPGITGLAQVEGRCELDFQQQVEYDVEYWRTWSVGRELLILLKTPAAVFQQRGAA